MSRTLASLLEDIEARRDGGVSPLSADPSLAAPLP